MLAYHVFRDHDFLHSFMCHLELILLPLPPLVINAMVSLSPLSCIRRVRPRGHLMQVLSAFVMYVASYSRFPAAVNVMLPAGDLADYLIVMM